MQRGRRGIQPGFSSPPLQQYVSSPKEQQQFSFGAPRGRKRGKKKGNSINQPDPTSAPNIQIARPNARITGKRRPTRVGDSNLMSPNLLGGRPSYRTQRPPPPREGHPNTVERAASEGKKGGKNQIKTKRRWAIPGAVRATLDLLLAHTGPRKKTPGARSGPLGA